MAGHASTDDRNFSHLIIDEDIFDRHFLAQIGKDSFGLFQVRTGNGKGNIRYAFVGNADTLDDHRRRRVFLPIQQKRDKRSPVYWESLKR